MYAIPHSRSGQLIIMWPIKKCFYMGERMGGVNNYSETTMSFISTRLKYMNTLNFQNILALLDIHDFCASVKHISAQWKIILKYHRNRDSTICKW